jgi:transcriptional regulator with XRE-family HTH domain
MARTPAEGPGPYYVLGEFIAQHRRARRMSQAELARRVGVSAGYIGHIERGTRKVSDRVLRRLADALGVDPLELYSRRAFGAPPVGDVAIHVAPEKAGYLRLIAQLPVETLRTIDAIWRHAREAYLEKEPIDDRAQNGAQHKQRHVDGDQHLP